MSTPITARPAAVRGKAGARALPSKTTLNLIVREKSNIDLTRLIPGVVLIVIAAVLFGKFAVADRFAELHAAESALRARQNELTALENSYADFDDVKKVYNQYTYRDYDRSIADRLDILTLLENDVLPYSDTQSLSINGNVFSTTLVGLTLDQVSAMMAKLEADPLVESVTVSTAGYDRATEEGQQPYATMTLVFKNADIEGGAAQ